MKPWDIYVYIIGIVHLTTCVVTIILVKRHMNKHYPEKKQAGEDRPAD
jgi:hypothetical protein